jgi:hypothetical protein
VYLPLSLGSSRVTTITRRPVAVNDSKIFLLMVGVITAPLFYITNAFLIPFLQWCGDNTDHGLKVDVISNDREKSYTVFDISFSDRAYMKYKISLSHPS